MKDFELAIAPFTKKIVKDERIVKYEMLKHHRCVIFNITLEEDIERLKKHIEKKDEPPKNKIRGTKSK